MPHLTLLLALLLGCPAPHPLPLDGAVDRATAPQDKGPEDTVRDATSHTDPAVRGRALAAMVRLDPDAWAPRGLADPNPWVQEATVAALCEHPADPRMAELLAQFVQARWGSAYVQGHAAMTCAPSAAARSWREAERWDQLPLALVAARAGDTEALALVQRALASAEVALELNFLHDLGNSGLVALIPALRAGQPLVEEELALDWAGARLALGDEEAEALLETALLRGDAWEQLEALDVLGGLATPSTEALLERAARRAEGVPADYAALLLDARRGKLSPGRLQALMEEGDQELRVQALGLAGHLAPRQARSLIRAGLADELATVRLAALDALIPLGADGEEDTLRAIFADDLLELQIAAAAALTAR
ncbi:MAG: hypothetical protein JXX28_18775 [Deltaproteobacteria bacterium]|nr:hypothetical protein [Deltaproteobacteria bacterium]